MCSPLLGEEGENCRDLQSVATLVAFMDPEVAGSLPALDRHTRDDGGGSGGGSSGGSGGALGHDDAGQAGGQHSGSSDGSGSELSKAATAFAALALTLSDSRQRTSTKDDVTAALSPRLQHVIARPGFADAAEAVLPGSLALVATAILRGTPGGDSKPLRQRTVLQWAHPILARALWSAGELQLPRLLPAAAQPASSALPWQLVKAAAAAMLRQLEAAAQLFEAVVRRTAALNVEAEAPWLLPVAVDLARRLVGDASAAREDAFACSESSDSGSDAPRPGGSAGDVAVAVGGSSGGGDDLDDDLVAAAMQRCEQLGRALEAAFRGVNSLLRLRGGLAALTPRLVLRLTGAITAAVQLLEDAPAIAPAVFAAAGRDGCLAAALSRLRRGTAAYAAFSATVTHAAAELEETARRPSVDPAYDAAPLAAIAAVMQCACTCRPLTLAEAPGRHDHMAACIRVMRTGKDVYQAQGSARVKAVHRLDPAAKDQTVSRLCSKVTDAVLAVAEVRELTRVNVRWKG